MLDVITQGENVLAALQANKAEVIAEQMESMLQLQGELSRSGRLERGDVESILAQVQGEVEAKIRLELESQLQQTQAAIDAFEQERRDRQDEQREEAEQRRRAAEQLLDRQQQLRQRVEQGRAELIAVMFSSPRRLDTALVSADGTATVRLPAGASGEHHIALVDADSGLIATWVPVVIEPAGEVMPRVGSTISAEVLALALAATVSGAVVWSRASSRPRPARRP